MNGSQLKEIFEEFFEKKFLRKKTLFIVLGLLGDFDSFEYSQSLVAFLTEIKNSKINLQIFAIGDEYSKERFCKYTRFPKEYIEVTKNNDFHRKLNLSSGLQLPINNWVNLNPAMYFTISF